MPVTRQLPPLPDAAVPVFDENGRNSDAWRRFYVALMVVLDEIRGLTDPAPTSVEVASLPSAASAGEGARRFVTNANSTTFNSIVAGGGSNNVPVFSDGTNWRIG
jgi:hypothetical protein